MALLRLNRHVLCWGVVAIVGLPAFASAQVRTLSELNGRIRAGTVLFVLDDLQHGQRVVYRGVDQETLFVIGGSIPERQIRRIDELRGSALDKGATIGASIGAGLALLGVIGCHSSYLDLAQSDRGKCDALNIGFWFGGGLGLGAAIGASVDRWATIYEAPFVGRPSAKLWFAPAVSRRGLGAQVGWRF